MKRILLSALFIFTACLLQAQTSALLLTGFNVSAGLVLDASGNLYVANSVGNTVSKVDPGGAVVATYTVGANPIALAIDAAGSIYVSIGSQSTVSKLDASGAVTATYTGFTYPVGLAFDGVGNLFVANETAGTISKVNPSGIIVATYSGFEFPAGLAFDGAGYLYVTNIIGTTVNKVDATGHIVATYSGFRGPRGISFDALGNMYVANTGGNNISMVPAGSPDGTTATDFISGLPYTAQMLTYHDHALYVSDGITSVYKITGGALTRQTHHYVKLNAAGDNDGSSWTDAYTNFQTAIDAALAGDSIFVAQATYQPASGTSFSMKEGVKIFGGFLGTEASFSERNLSGKATLQGNGNSVIVNSGLTAASVLDGFIITGGYANTNTNGHGGGGICNNNASPTLRNLVITGNGCNYYGGGVANNNGSPLLENVIIQNNTTTGDGGGISISNATVTLRNVLISGNSASQGGGLNSEFGSVILTNVTITGNTATQAGGIYALDGATTLNNSIVWGNSAASTNEIYLFLLFSASMDLHHSLYANGTGDVNDEYNSIMSTDHNFSVSPQFVDSAGGNYQLMSTSPCIDAGSPDATGLNVGDIDLAGNARIVGAAIDIGAYEFDGTLPVRLISFTGVWQKGVANFQWHTGAEENFNHFELQAGTDGNTFSTVATIDAKGSNSRYTASVPQSSTSAYYRLKMVDINGRGKFSKIVRLLQSTSGGIITLYPNPAHNYLHVTAVKAGGLQIYDASGRLVKKQTVKKGGNTVNISTLAGGMYYLQVNGEKSSFEKIK